MPISTASSCVSASAADPAEVLRSAPQRQRSTSPSTGTPASSPTSGGYAGSACSRTPSFGWEHLDAPRRSRAATRRSAASSSAARSPTASTGSRSSGSSSGTSTRQYRPSDSAVFLNNTATTDRMWSRYRYRPAHARRLLERAGCRRGRTASTSAPASGCRCASIRPPAPPFDNEPSSSSSAAPAGGNRGGSDLRFRAFALFGEILPSGDFDVAALRMVRKRSSQVERRSSAAAATRTTRATASAW